MSKEICICAAFKTEDGQIIRGHRHHDCLRAIYDRKLKPLKRINCQGFITSKNRFVDRKRGLWLQESAGIKSARGKYTHELFSEDLY